MFFYAGLDSFEKCIMFVHGQAMDGVTQLGQVVIAPHTGFSARHLFTLRDVVPSIGPVIYRMKQDALMFRVHGEVGFFQECMQHGQPCFQVPVSLFRFCSFEDFPQPDQTLCPDGGRRTVDRFVVIERIGR